MLVSLAGPAALEAVIYMPSSIVRVCCVTCYAGGAQLWRCRLTDKAYLLALSEVSTRQLKLCKEKVIPAFSPPTSHSHIIDSSPAPSVWSID